MLIDNRRACYTLPLGTVLVLVVPVILLLTSNCPTAAQQGYDDHASMMDQLGIKAIRQGPDPNNQSTFDEANANPYKDSMPDVLKMKDGRKVTTARQWPTRRAEILEDFEREVYGRIPKNVKAAIVTEAFDPRVAVGLIGSSGEGGVKLHRHLYGEAVENLAGGEYYWMAGNFIKYGASDPPKTAADLPVDSHELIALCAPRPCFISYGTVEHGDAKWVDAHGSFMAAVLAGPVYMLLGKKDLGTPGDYLTDLMPPIKTLIGGELAWRQHEGGHDVTPNWPAFFDWVPHYIKAAPLPAASSGKAKSAATEIPTAIDHAPPPTGDPSVSLALKAPQ